MSGLEALDTLVLQSGNSGEILLFLVIGFLGGLYLVYDGFETWKLSELIQNTPTSKVRSMAVGRTELEGTVREFEGRLNPPYTDADCVYVKWEAEKRERHTDKDGHTHYTWETVAKGKEALAFLLEDQTGTVLIRADEDLPEFDINDSEHSRTVYFSHGQMPPADLGEYVMRFRQREDTKHESEDSGGLLSSAINSVADFMEADNPLTNTSKRRRYTQTILPIGTHIYLFGSAEPRKAGTMQSGQQDLLEVGRDSETGQFLVSDSSEEELQGSYSRWGPLKTVAGIIVSAVALYFLLSWYIAPGA